jgi:hypothetical protein
MLWHMLEELTFSLRSYLHGARLLLDLALTIKLTNRGSCATIVIVLYLYSNKDCNGNFGQMTAEV